MEVSKTENKVGYRKKEVRGGPNLPQGKKAKMRDDVTFTFLNLTMMIIHLLMLRGKPFSRKYITLS